MPNDPLLPSRLEVLNFELRAIRPLRLVDNHSLAEAGRQREKELEATIAELTAKLPVAAPVERPPVLASA